MKIIQVLIFFYSPEFIFAIQEGLEIHCFLGFRICVPVGWKTYISYGKARGRPLFLKKDSQL
jgi:hypothetical protein